ncbi:SOS response-associated peptidase [Paralimibaculum aggregatum]|uniref:Abasic site processing protein n=1 Tax=Paralimibaculum aggregatum TaxID=3036245 RepID=A0ABQ6LKW0_9RHOB|nr:SOS response-associated peptidase [Limibaculum sp. NKW23]
MPEGAAWAEWLATAEEGPWPAANWNVAPTQAVAIVTGAAAPRQQRLARWGLVPRWWSKPLAELRASTFNARSEEAHAKPMFRDAWKRARCLVPALGYYEWTGRKGARQPWFVTLERNAPGIAFAGLWAEAEIAGERLTSVTILTCAAGPATAHLHPRSPVILAETDWEAWLSCGEGGDALMRPPPDDRVRLWQVDPRVGRVSENGPEQIERAGLDL